MELLRFGALGVLLDDPLTLCLVNAFSGQDIAQERQRDSMTLPVRFCQGKVNSAEALRFPLRYGLLARMYSTLRL